MTDPYPGRTTDANAETEFLAWFESVQGKRVGVPVNGAETAAFVSVTTPEGSGTEYPGYDPSAGRGSVHGPSLEERAQEIIDRIFVNSRSNRAKTASFEHTA